MPKKGNDTPVRVPEKIKQRLYSVVLDFFAENDFHQVNLRKISKVSGLSTGTIYKYFKSKEDLILEILEEKLDEIKQLGIIHDQGLKNTKERFRKSFWALMDYYDRNPSLAISFFITVPTRTWMQRESYARYDIHELISKIADEGRACGEIDPTINNVQITSLYFMHLQREITIWYYRGRQWKLVDSLDYFFPLFWKTVSSC